MPQTFYRLLDGGTATRGDFLSYKASGVQVQDETEEMRRLSEGVSVMATLQQARKRARQVPSLRGKRFVAELLIPDDSSITWERTTKTPGHHTLWGDPDAMLRCVVSVFPV